MRKNKNKAVLLILMIAKSNKIPLNENKKAMIAKSPYIINNNSIWRL
jgi:hypothetical protein